MNYDDQKTQTQIYLEDLPTEEEDQTFRDPGRPSDRNRVTTYEANITAWLDAEDDAVGLGPEPEMIGNMTLEEFDRAEAGYSGLFPTAGR